MERVPTTHEENFATAGWEELKGPEPRKRLRLFIMKDDIAAVLSETKESARVEFKRQCDPSVLGECLELIKDIVAIANSGGGTIVVGVENDGSPSSSAAALSLLTTDPADIANKIYKYTDCQFASFRIERAVKAECDLAVIVIGPAHVPLIFTKEGGYNDAEGKPKRAFNAGSIYFRHGAKSEPGCTSDLSEAIEREMDRRKKFLTEGIAKVISAPHGSEIRVVTPTSMLAVPGSPTPIRLVDDPSAASVPHIHVDVSHPHRQKEVVALINAKLNGRCTITPFNILCIRRVFEIQKKLHFCYTQNHVSPRYSDAFVDWVIEQFESNPSFFSECHRAYLPLKEEAAGGKKPKAFAT